jgi:excisionase family DNA binding protein
MERVSIQEASRRLNLSQATIRQCIRDGELKGLREPGPNGRPTWLVELPEEGWTHATTGSLLKMAEGFSPWWWPNGSRTGVAHYVEDLGIEEIIPQFLCGLISENIWTAKDLLEHDLCPTCLALVKERGLPLAL